MSQPPDPTAVDRRAPAPAPSSGTGSGAGTATGTAEATGAAGAAEVTGPTTSTPTGRRVWIDQARWLAVALVLVGHLVGPLRGRSTLAHAISDFLYMFHIPTLILLAGWGARRATASGAGLVRIFWQLLVPYVCFQLIAFAVNYLVDGAHPSWRFVDQTFGLWFLVALAGWRLLAPWFHGLRAPVVVALAVALVAGLSPAISTTLALSRIAFFLPIFIAGPWLVERVSTLRHRRTLRLAGVAVLGAAFLAVAWRQPDVDRTIFFGRDSYEDLGEGPLRGAAERTAALVLSTALSVALLLAVPVGGPRTAWLSRWAAEAGRHTMYPYLLHLPVLTLAAATGWYRLGNPTVAAVVAACVGASLAVLFVSRPVRFLAGPVVEPRAWYDDVRRSLQRAPAPRP